MTFEVTATLRISPAYHDDGYAERLVGYEATINGFFLYRAPYKSTVEDWVKEHFPNSKVIE